MIDGLWIEMSSGKLCSLLEGRASYHRDKAVWYRKQVETLTQEIEENTNVSNNPIQSLRTSQTNHENKATFFAMLAENLIPNETYRLSEQNCIRIELYAQYF